MLSVLRIRKCILRTWRGEWVSYSPQGVGLPIYSAFCAMSPTYYGGAVGAMATVLGSRRAFKTAKV